MTRFLPALMLSLILLQALFVPAAVQAGTVTICLIRDVLSTLPATDITDTTAVFRGRETQVWQLQTTASDRASQAGLPYPWGFKYGTEPGIYTNTMLAHLASFSDKVDTSGNEVLVWTDEASVSGLKPCTTYYALYVYLGPTQTVGAAGQDCPAPVFSNAREITFTTTGCMTRTTLGQGSTGTGAGATPSWPKPVQMSNIIVQSATIAAPRVSPGQQVDVTASVTNKGGSNGDARVTLYVNGEEVESKGITVSSGETTPVHFIVSRNEPGTYSVYVSGVSAGNFTVDLFTNNDILIYGLIALVTLGITGTLYLVTRRRSA